MKVPKKVKRRVEIWTSEKQKRSMPRSMASESEQLLGVVRKAAFLTRSCITLCAWPGNQVPGLKV